jgi:hypothetical protein
VMPREGLHVNLKQLLQINLFTGFGKQIPEIVTPGYNLLLFLHL